MDLDHHRLYQQVDSTAHDVNNLAMVLLHEISSLRQGPGGPPMLRMEAITYEIMGHLRALRSAVRTPSGPQLGSIRLWLLNNLPIFRQLLGQNVTLSLTLGEGRYRTSASAHTLRRALLNLLLNARQAMAHRGHVTVTVADGPDGDILMSVQDSGPGVPEHLCEQIFARTYSSSPSPERGQGLALAREGLRDIGGDLRLRPTPGFGACFEICLPRALGDDL